MVFWVTLSSRATTVINGVAWQPSSATVSFPQRGANLLPTADQINKPIRKMALVFALSLVFLRVSMFGQMQSGMMGGIDLKLLWVIGIPCLVTLIMTGGIQHAVKGRTGLFYLALGLWIAFATPFSSWRGSSFSLLTAYWRTNLIMFFAVAGIALTWRECRMFMQSMFWGAVLILFASRLYADGTRFDYREGMQFGSIANPNDLAGHLLFALPFVLWVVLNSRKVVLRLFGVGVMAFGLKLVLGTASRGALVGLAVAVLLFFWRGSGRQRMSLLLLGPLVVMVVSSFVSPEALRRIVTFSSSDASAEELEATQSSSAREYTLKKSFEYMFEFPIFGVGPGQFASYEGRNNQVIGTHGYWHETHNSYTQVASECGLPGGLLLIGGVISTLGLLTRTLKMVKGRGDCRDIHNAALSALASAGGFFAAATFLNFGYSFYFPLLGGIAVLIHTTAQGEIYLRDLAAAETSQTARRPAH
jgi:O-antigen ligase